MTILVVGATGATGRLVVEQLLNRGQNVKVIVRSPEKLPKFPENSKNLTIIKASILELNNEDLTSYVDGCDAIISCLGHNITFKGMYGHPRRLVTDSAEHLCNAVKMKKPSKKVKYILMNTTGNSNRDIREPVSFGQKLVISLIRLLVPPHVDNEKAADYLRRTIGQDDNEIEWIAVRPDNLINDKNVSNYKIYTSPIRSAIFNPGRTSRINVAHFMADLITDDMIWNKWKGKMPVIYNE
jgi:putative NADH-flavin reductase